MSDTATETMLDPRLAGLGPERVVHPLDDAPEAKLYDPALGRMPLTGTVKFSLALLQAYLALMLAMLGWRLLDLAGAI